MNSVDKMEKAIFDLYLWRNGLSDHFTCKLYSLMAKADSTNLHKLGMVFPAEHAAFNLWSEASDEIEFFKTAGLGKEEKHEQVK